MCISSGSVCEAAKLKQCLSCQNILKSVCSKSSCIVEGKKPEMILPKCGAKKLPAKNLFPQCDEEDSDVTDSESENEVEMDDSSDDDEISLDTRELQRTWAFLSPANPEPKGKWFAVEYRGKRRRGQLLIAKVLKRFLEDEDGPIESFEMKCLKPKVGSGIVLDDTPNHLPDDIWHFKMDDIIKGPIEVSPKGSMQFVVPAYEEIACILPTSLNIQLENGEQPLVLS